jgi:hypothetical protein
MGIGGLTVEGWPTSTNTGLRLATHTYIAESREENWDILPFHVLRMPSEKGIN